MRRYVEQQPAKETPSRSYSVTVGVVIHNEQPPWLYMGTEGADGFLRIGGMLHYADAHNDVELFRGDGNVQNVSLTNVVILVMLAVYAICFHRGRQVHGKHIGSGFKHDLGETTRAAAGFEDVLTSQSIQGAPHQNA